MECAAIQDCLEACRVLGSERNVQGKAMLIRLVSMLTKLGRRNHELREEETLYGDNDNDNEEGGKSQQTETLDAHSSRQ